MIIHKYQWPPSQRCQALQGFLNEKTHKFDEYMQTSNWQKWINGFNYYCYFHPQHKPPITFLKFVLNHHTKIWHLHKTTNIQPVGKCCHESKTNYEGNYHIPKNINWIIMDIFVSTIRNIIKTISVHNQAIKTCTQHHSSTLVIDTTFIVACLFLLKLIIVVIIETKKQKLDPKTPRLDYKRRPKLPNQNEFKKKLSRKKLYTSNNSNCMLNLVSKSKQEK